MEVGEEGDYIPITIHCHNQNDSCIKVGSDESHFNVSVGSDGQSHKTVSTNHNLGPSAYQPNAVPLGQNGSRVDIPLEEFIYLVAFSLACHVRVTVGNSGLCCCASV